MVSTFRAIYLIYIIQRLLVSPIHPYPIPAILQITHNFQTEERKYIMDNTESNKYVIDNNKDAGSQIKNIK